MNDILEWARDRPLFTVNEAERVSGLQRDSLVEKLSRLHRRGDLHRVQRGTYTVHDDPMIYSTHVEYPSYMTLWSGLRFYDLTTQEPTKIQVMVSRTREDLSDIAFLSSKQLFGFRRTRYRDFDIFVADEERLLLDCLGRASVPVKELQELLSVVNIEKTTRFAERLSTGAIKKRVGYLLETIRGVSVEELRVQDRNYPVLDLTGPEEGQTNARWRLRVNTDVV